ncbi:YoaK family protein [Mycobacterium sp. ML4]
MKQTTTTLPPAVLLTLANGFLDAHTFLELGGVFANVQTANVIFFALDLVQQNWAPAFSRLWPIFAFMVGVAVAAHIKSGRVQKVTSYPLRWTMGFQAAFFIGVGFLGTVSASFVTVPIAFLAGIQIGLFRSIGDLNYLPVATTGNLMRLVEAGYTGFVDGQSKSRRAFRVYATLIGAFAVGAGIGTAASRAYGHHAIWIPAGCLVVTLVLVVSDERAGRAG